jgi:hypothetical protein
LKSEVPSTMLSLVFDSAGLTTCYAVRDQNKA